MKSLQEKRDYLTRQITERKAAMLDAERVIKTHEEALAGLYGAIETVEMLQREAAEAMQSTVAKAAGKGEAAVPAGNAGLDLSTAPQNLE